MPPKRENTMDVADDTSNRVADNGRAVKKQFIPRASRKDIDRANAERNAIMSWVKAFLDEGICQDGSRSPSTFKDPGPVETALIYREVALEDFCNRHKSILKESVTNVGYNTRMKEAAQRFLTSGERVIKLYRTAVGDVRELSIARVNAEKRRADSAKDKFRILQSSLPETLDKADTAALYDITTDKNAEIDGVMSILGDHENQITNTDNETHSTQILSLKSEIRRLRDQNDGLERRLECAANDIVAKNKAAEKDLQSLNDAHEQINNLHEQIAELSHALAEFRVNFATETARADRTEMGAQKIRTKVSLLQSDFAAIL